MSEYTDLKNRTHRVLETVSEQAALWEQKEREAAEQEIVQALFRILLPERDGLTS